MSRATLRAALALLFVLGITGFAAAADTAAAESARARTRPAAALPGGAWLALMVVAGGLALWRYTRKGRQMGSPELAVVAQASLGGKARAVWVRAGERELLLAVGPTDVRVLERWDSPAPRSDAATAQDAPPRAAPRALARQTCAPLTAERPRHRHHRGP